MDDPVLVRCLEGFRHLLRDRQGFVEGDRAAGDALREVVALDEFHHQDRHACALFEPVDGGDVGMVQ